MNINAMVNYHVTSLHEQAFRFDVDGIEGNLVAPELNKVQVHVKDLRDNFPLSFAHDGIAFKRSPTGIQNFTQAGWRAKYEKEISHLLSESIAAKDVIIFDHTVRIDDIDASRKPARNVHNDYSSVSANQRLIDLVGKEEAASFSRGHFAFVNVWRPIESVVKSSPLGFIQPNSVKAEDWLDIELIYPDRRGQILGLLHNPKHEWFYISDMTPEEVIIFNIYDNKGRAHLAHSALDGLSEKHSSAGAQNAPRKSIETRTLIRF
jgi:hypothetical protein